MPIKEIVENRMRERGLSYTALAATVGISSAYLSDLLLGRRGQRTWEKWGPKIAFVLGIDPSELLREAEQVIAQK